MKKTLQWLKQHKVAVLKGGWSRERSISLKTGRAVEEAFKRLDIPFISIDVKRNVRDILVKNKIQFCFIALHGTFGEDGGIQSILQNLRIAFTGSDSIASGIAMDKSLSKKLFFDNYVPTPHWVTLKKGQSTERLEVLLKNTPLFVKPTDQGSALGASQVQNVRQLKSALNTCFKISKEALVEKFIAGRELTVGILGDKPLPVVEIIPKHAFYDFHSKYAAGGSRHVVPARLSPQETKRAKYFALKAFHALQCRVVGRVDLLLDNKGEFFVLEVNTIPGMTATSLLPDAARAAGLSFDDLVLKICEFSLKERRQI